MSESEINNLIAEYNAVEDEQRARLIRLYDLIDARTGYRKIQFSNFAWSNCWGWTPRADAIAKFIEALVRPIISADIGGEPTE